MIFSAWPTTEASVRWKRSCATIFRSSPAAALNSFHQLSPYESAKPMKATFFKPFFFMSSTSAVAISESFCGILNAQARLGSDSGSTMTLEAASAIIGVPVSASTSRPASAAAVVLGPTMASTLSSEVSLRMFFTARLTSVPSSSTT